MSNIFFGYVFDMVNILPHIIPKAPNTTNKINPNQLPLVALLLFIANAK